MKTLTTSFLQSLSFTPPQAEQLHFLGEFKSRFVSLAGVEADTLESLRLMALVESTESSNRIEGIVTTRHRVEALVLKHTAPRDRAEKEIAGYRDALDLIHNNHAEMPCSQNVILQLHSMLYRASTETGGYWKLGDNVIKQINKDGTEFIRFQPVSAFDTPAAMEHLMENHRYALQQGYSPIILMPLFILDFLCIHPFRDGNGRVSRLLNLMLLYHAGHTVGRYISLERIVEERKDEYYEALAVGSHQWHEGKADVGPWISYMYSVLVQAYRELEQRAGSIKTNRGSKTILVAMWIQTRIKPFQFKDLQSACPGVSVDQLKNVLRQLKAQGKVRLEGRGAGARWMRTFK